MPYSIHLLVALATLPDRSTAAQTSAGQQDPTALPEVIAPVLERVLQLVEQFRQQQTTPTATCRFEQQVQREVRELARTLVQWTYNQLEPDVDHLAKHVRFEASEYTRLNRKTPQNAWTLFGQVRLLRVGYRPTDKSGDATLFPLAMALGLVHGATPALAER